MSLLSEDEEMNLKNDEQSQSDIKSEEEYDEKDYYNDKNKDYKEADPLPSLEPPKLIINENKNQNENKNKNFKQINETYMNFDEKFQKIKNEESLEDEFPNVSADDICDNYKFIFKNNIEYSSNSLNMYSKDHLRITLEQEIKNLDWKNKENEINNAKKETNAYEGLDEKCFQKKQSLQLANINYLFEKEIIKYNSIFKGFPVLIVGDTGGFTDYILYCTKEEYNPTIFVIPEKTNFIKEMTYRKEIKEKVEENVHILNEFFEENKDIDENSNISVDFLNNIAKKISEKTGDIMVDLYIARKVINFNPDYSQEIKYKKFLLMNTLLAFKTLAYGGNFIIKLYDAFTPFTIGLIYFIFKNFESVSIFKPVSTRQYSSSRYLVAENYLKETADSSNKAIKYLEEFLTKYIKFSSNNYDIKYFLPPSEIRTENFLKIIYEINNDITEKRIDALKEIIKYLNNQNTKLYDKMSIRKFFLDNWGLPVIHYDESLLLKNQEHKNKNKYEKYNSQQKKIYSEKELMEFYGNAGTLDKDQEKILNSILGNNNRTKKEKKIHKGKEKPKTLDEKYEYLSQKILKGKRNYTPKKKEKEKEKEKQVLNKKRERTNTENTSKKKDKNYNNTSSKKEKKEKYKIGKIDKGDKKEDKNDEDDFEDDKELFGFSSEVKKKLEKHDDDL